MDFEGAQRLADQIDESLPIDAMRGFEKQFQDMVEQATLSAYEYLRENLGYWYAHDIRQASDTAIEAILKGQVNIARQYLKLDGYNGRSDGYNPNRTIDKQHPIIHGCLNESECLKIRRMVAEAHPELVRDERIKDLEDQVASLVAQNNKLEKELDDTRRKLYR